ncbi:hypothetical protein I0Q91_07215 [Halanaerobiaceae bacterium Z-7014]|uniref:Na+/H+ antiporter NhaC-like C-terminal domain-containing protein n=1 Tax=Halonatronomonas betaini TaxID=2778430 RepID=A0A931F9T9_9FIRM|nr:Na+/H+ antiporter NhaC family protein [Halonatronomonas betaini]MBF8436859.1 hypothetical protein [Halonatronomonas betaini]
MELSFKQAIIPVITMAFLIIMSVLVWDVPIQIALFFEIIIIVCLSFIWGYRWKKIEKMMFSSFRSIGNVIIILFLIGMMIGLWIAIGTVPTMIYYGLETINPEYFLVLSFISTSLVSMAIGTAVGTASTIGLALISIAETLGMSLPLAAGAIISGAYVGDRMSPVSSIANITAHSAEADILEMVKSMMKTTILPYIIAAIVYLIIGLNLGGLGENAGGFLELTAALDSYFMISFWMLLPPILIISMAFLKVPTIINLAINIIFSLILGIAITDRNWSGLLNIMFQGFDESSGITFIDNILARGGLTSMLELISLIIFAVILGGLLEQLGVLDSILKPIVHHITGKIKLAVVTVFSSILSAILGCNQFLAVFLPARMLIPHYDRIKVKRKELARALGDSGLVFSPLIPWNVNALMMTAVLGVDTFYYAPYAFFILIMPLSNILITVIKHKKELID